MFQMLKQGFIKIYKVKKKEKKIRFIINGHNNRDTSLGENQKSDLKN